MKNLKIDYFKLSIVLILLGILVVFSKFSMNGRYQSLNERVILDTRTGATYGYHNANEREGNPILISKDISQ